MSRPVPPPRPTWRGVWEKEKLLERPAGVAESSGRIQVSVKPKMLRVDCKEKAEMKSALLTADWQFQRAIEKERGVVEDVEMGCMLAGLRCRLRVMLEHGRETTGMGLKHMIEVEGYRIAKESVWGKGEKIILKCVAGVVAWVKSRRKKSLVFTLVCLHTRMLWISHLAIFSHNLLTRYKLNCFRITDMIAHLLCYFLEHFE